MVDFQLPINYIDINFFKINYCSMKKIGLLAIAAAAMIGTSAASAQETTYVEDCSQGYLINRAKDNWFITAEGGANMLFGHYDIHSDIKNRIGPQANLFVGKWVTPVFGFRFGASWLMPKGATIENGFFRKMNAGPLEGGSKYYEEKFMGLGPEFDVMLNLTNWWCGYNPDRVYNAVLHGGAGAYWTFARRYKDNDIKWRAAHNTILFANLGLQNNFRVSKHVQLFIDAQFEIIDFSNIEPAGSFEANYTASLNAGFTYNFGKTDWNCPVTAVCPTWKYTDAEGDALVAEIDRLKRRINDLEGQIRGFEEAKGKNRKVVDAHGGLCTIYYPINVYTLDKRDKIILNSVADLMNKTGKDYDLVGYADTYTGTTAYNADLRKKRVNGVKTYLMGRGVSETQLNATASGDVNLVDIDDPMTAPLDRAVTIAEAE